MAVIGALVGSTLLSACSGSHHHDPNPPGPNGPNVVNAEPAGGSPGVGPVVAPPPVTAPGGQAQPQHVQLTGRSITINAATTVGAQPPGATAVDVDVTISNQGATPVPNATTCYTLIGAEGDTFGAVSASPGFTAPIAGGSSRRGTVQFDVPRAALKNLRLLYRSGDGSASALVQLPLA